MTDADPRCEQMIQTQLVRRGIDDARVLDAMRRVPRHRFVRPEDQGLAYDDGALPTRHGQTISQPYVVALMTQMLDVPPGTRVLEVGTGSGYQAAVLAAMGAVVFSVERDAALASQAMTTLRELGYAEHVMIHVGDGTLGWAEHAPYDRVLVTAAGPMLPPALREQAADHARIVMPIGDRDTQHLVTFDRQGERWHRTDGLAVRFVPLVGRDGWTDGGNAAATMSP